MCWVHFRCSSPGDIRVMKFECLDLEYLEKVAEKDFLERQIVLKEQHKLKDQAFV